MMVGLMRGQDEKTRIRSWGLCTCEFSDPANSIFSGSWIACDDPSFQGITSPKYFGSRLTPDDQDRPAPTVMLACLR